MKELFPHSRTMAAELLGALSEYPGEFFSPGELLPTLRACPAWGEYLTGFETDRGQPAAVGRYLVDAGLVKAGHHRTRGSLYSRAATLARLQEEMVAANEPKHAVTASSPAVVPEIVPAPAVAVEPVVVEMAAAVAAGAGAAPATTELPRAAASVSAPPPGEPATSGETLRRHRDQPAPTPTAAPASAVIGWRRRASDRGESGRPGAPMALPPAPGGGQSPPAGTPPAYPLAGAAPPPLWVGSGTAVAPASYPGMMSPYAVPMEIPGVPAAADEGGLPLDFYWAQIRHHIFKIAVATVAVTTLVGFYTLRIPKLYASVATLRMDFSVPAIQQDAATNPAFDPTTLIQTEVSDVGLRAVVLNAIHTAHLERDPNLLRELNGGKPAAPTVANPDARDDQLVGLIQTHLAAVSPDNTHNIQVSYTSLSPETSATVANAVGNALISHEFQTRQQEQNQLLAFMNQQFDDIQVRVEREQKDLSDYQHQYNILNPDSQNSLESNTLSTISNNYLTAQEALTKLQAEEDMLKSGQITDALLASDDGQALQPAYAAWQAAQKNFDAVKLTRGAANPAYQAASQALAVAKQQLDQTTTSTRNQIDSKYQRAKHQLDLINQQLGAARDSMQTFNEHMVGYTTQKNALDTDLKLQSDLEAQIKQQQVTSSLSGSGLRITDLATPNPTPVYPSVRRNAMLAVMFSLFFGAGLAILAGYMDRSFTNPESVEQYLRVPLLGALPLFSSKDNPLAMAAQPGSPSADGEGKDQMAKTDSSPRSAFVEAMLMLRTSIMYAAPQGFRTLSVTSSQPQEGKSVVIANLAIAFARHGAKVLLVDCDIRRPTQHRLFEVPNQVGLSSLLRQSAPLENSFRPTTVERLYLMTAGPAVANPSELVATQLGPVLGALTAEFDYVLVDSPPLLGFADAVAIATSVDATMMIARAGKTRREVVQAALQPLKRVRARVIGLALNQVHKKLSPYYSYYQSQSAYYYTQDAESKSES